MLTCEVPFGYKHFLVYKTSLILFYPKKKYAKKLVSAVGFLYTFFRSLRLKMQKCKVTQNDAKAFLSVATPAEPRESKGMMLRKYNCLSEASFVFLGMDLLSLGNLTQLGSKPLQELFGTFLRRKKYRREVHKEKSTEELLQQKKYERGLKTK